MTRPQSIQEVLESAPDGAFLSQWAKTRSLSDASEAFDEIYPVLLGRLHREPGQVARVVEAIDAGRQDLDRVRKAQLLRLRAHAARGTGHIDTSVQLYQQAWDRFQRLGLESELPKTAVGWTQSLGILADSKAAQRLLRRLEQKKLLKDASLRARLFTNIANACLHARELEDANRFYLRAERTFRARGMTVERSFCLHGRANVQLKRGESTKARALFTRASEGLDGPETGIPRLYAQSGIAICDLLLGQWDDGLRLLRDVRRSLDDFSDRRTAAEMRHQTAVLFASLGAPAAALNEEEEAYRTIRELGSLHDEARLAYVLGRLEADRGAFPDAHRMLTRARDIWKKTKNRLGAARADLELERLAFQRKQPVDKSWHSRLRSLQGVFDRAGAKTDGARCRALRGMVHLKNRKPAAALPLLDQARRMATAYPVRLERPSMTLAVAQAHSAVGRGRESIQWARRATKELESLLHNFGSRHLRSLGGGARDRIYPQAVELILSHGGDRADQMAVDLISRARSPQLIEDLLQSQGVQASPKAMAALHELRDDLLWDDRPDVRGAHSEAERAARSLAERWDLAQVRSSQLVQRALEARGYAQWKSRLDRQLVLFDRGHRGYRAFVIDQAGGIRRLELPDLESTVGQTLQPFRLMMEMGARCPQDRREDFLSRTKASANDLLVSLYESAVRPLELEAGPVTVVPDGFLHAAPLEAAAIVGGSRPHQWSRLPHPALLGAERRRPTRRALLLRGPQSDMGEELEELIRRLDLSDFETVVVDRRADLERLKGRFDLIHVAAHGSFHRRQWMLTGLQLSDGWIGFEQLRRGRVGGALLFLASCESGLAGELPGADLQGWLTAGLAAGAREMTLTLWKIDNYAASVFTDPFYRAWLDEPDAGRAAAVARETLATAGEHPFRWAPFVTVG